MNNKLTPSLWNSVSIQFSSVHFTTANINEYLCNDDVAKEILSGIISHGIAFINQVPTNLQTTEAVVKRLFAIERTHLASGEIVSIGNGMTEANDMEMPHTDMCYLSAAPGLTILCSFTNSSVLLVDGFSTLHTIQMDQPEMYKRICAANVTHRYGIVSEKSYHHTAPMVTLGNLTGEPEIIR